VIEAARKQWKPILLSLVLVPLGFLSLPLVFVVSNAGSAIISLITNREPTRAELIGAYDYTAPWGSAGLTLNEDGTYREVVAENNGSTAQFSGVWGYRDADNSAEIGLRNFGMVDDDDHSRKIDLCTMNFYTRRLGKTYAVINEDLGEHFERQ